VAKLKDMKCNTCGIEFNEADLSEVFKHEHADIEAPKTKSKRVITHASDIYPHCSGQFAGGVHSFLSGDPNPTQQDPAEFRQGYYRASFDCEDVILERG
jgi:hypothetical protein